MRSPGVIGTIQLAATLVFALPLALFGLSWIADGRPLGAVFVAIAALMLVLGRYLTNPFDPGDVAEVAVDHVTNDEE